VGGNYADVFDDFGFGRIVCVAALEKRHPMTTTDIAGLCERLRNTGLESAAEAADTIERQAVEIERLRGAAQAANRIRITALVYEDADLLEDIEMVLAALTGEDA
jgi:hypothetical protein